MWCYIIRTMGISRLFFIIKKVKKFWKTYLEIRGMKDFNEYLILYPLAETLRFHNERDSDIGSIIPYTCSNFVNYGYYYIIGRLKKKSWGGRFFSPYPLHNYDIVDQ